ncbi:MAG: 5-dehydro-4-deoxyglucarate dehydratase [Nocardioidaceae bacterium]
MPDTSAAHAELVRRLRLGMERAVLAFPLTPFDAAGEVDPDAFGRYLEGQVAAGPGAVFVCCGTGEFFSLSLPEYERLVAVAVEVTAGRVPVVAGAGYGWAQAVEYVSAAERAGADAVLLMPHYLVDAPQAGVVAHLREVAGRTSLPLIVYQRAQVRLSTGSVREIATIPQVIGLKDGHGDLDQVQRIRLVAPREWLFFNGVATAEMQARAYDAIGVRAYSSAVHAFAPEIAQAFFAALHRDDHEAVDTLLREFYLPLVELRDKGVGYAVSLIKAAARIRGAEVGPVRAPLTDPTPAHLAELEQLVTAGLGLVGADAERLGPA